ncbi:MAG: hypothetical protein ACRD3O_01095, partial [Terriglobia bacterium]
VEGCGRAFGCRSLLEDQVKPRVPRHRDHDVLRHGKNSLFYKTQNGAEVGDLFMSLIHTCELNGVNPFSYLIELQKHAAELADHPAGWMPWNYQQALGHADSRACG